LNIKTIDEAYSLVEFYEYGSIDQRIYLEACAYALKFYEKKYGKDDFRFRELFAHMQGDDWENTFKVRALLHTEVIGCPHKTIAECDKHNNGIYSIFKGKKCQHCNYLEGIEDEWKRKLEGRKD
jgi:hypothetical protein